MASKKLLFQISPDGYQAILNNEPDANGFKVKLSSAQIFDTTNVNRGAFPATGRLIGSDQITLRVKISDSVNTYSVKELRLIDAYSGKVFGRIYRDDGTAIDVINPAKFAVIIANIKLSAVPDGSVTIVDSSESDATLAGALDGHIASPSAHKWIAITDKPNLNTGVGLSGGGSLNDALTIKLSTPSTITATSTNTATANASAGHSHAIDKATTAIAGIVQLSNSLSSSSTALALTAAQGKYLDEKKADKGTKISEYGITDAYTKTEINPLNITDASVNEVTTKGHTHFISNSGVGTRGLVALSNTVGTDNSTEAPTMGRFTADTFKIPSTSATLDDASLKPLSLYSFTAADGVAGFTGFGYLKSTAYGSNAQITQTLVPYASASNPRMWLRHKYADSWTAWGRIDGADFNAGIGDTGYIANKPTTLSGWGIVDWVLQAYSGGTNIIANAVGQGVHSYGGGGADAPTWIGGTTVGASKVLQVGAATWDSQIAFHAYSECVWIRAKRVSGGSYQAWQRLDGGDWSAVERSAGYISNKPTTWSELEISNVMNTDAVQTISGAKAFINTATFSSVGLVGFSSWQNAIQLSGNLPVLNAGTFGIGFHRLNKTLYFIDIENQSYLASFTFSDNKATFTGALNAAGGLFKGTVEAAYSNVNLAAGVGLTGGGTLATSRGFAIDKATAANITAGTANKVVTADILAPFLNKTYTNVTSSRALGVNYTNNTGYEISVHVDGRVDGGASAAVAYVNGVVVNRLATISQSGISIIGTFSFVVPPGATYQVTGMGTAHSSAPYKWVEYR